MLEREAGHAIADPVRQVRGFIDLIGHGDPRAPAADVDRYRRIACPVWVLRGSEDRDWMPGVTRGAFPRADPGGAGDALGWESATPPTSRSRTASPSLLNEFLRAS